MAMAPVDLAEITFFELDRLFNESARAFQRKLRRKRRKNKELKQSAANDGSTDLVRISPSRSRTPPPKNRRFSKVQVFGGFTGAVDKVEKTIVVSGLPETADEKSIYLLFSRCGVVGDVKILQNRLEARTGIVVVEFLEDEAVARACNLPPPLCEINGSVLQVKRADSMIPKGAPAPKRMMTRSQFTQQVLSGLKTGAGPATDGPHMRKLHIKNLRPVVTEDDMKGIFKPFVSSGEFEAFSMGTLECWITFASHSDAQDALSSMQGFQLVGQELQITMQSVEVQPPPVPAPPPPPKQDTVEQQIAKDTDFGATGSEGSSGRVELMKKLLTSHQQEGIPTVAGVSGAAATTPAPPGGAPAPPPPPGAPPPPDAALPPAPKPGGPTSRTLLLQNMFTPGGVNLNKDPKFYEEIREDTHEECSKFGKVAHVTVDPRGANGLIYVLYETPGQRQAAELALNGRWFEGKKILAAGIDDSIWQDLAKQAGGK